MSDIPQYGKEKPYDGKEDDLQRAVATHMKFKHTRALWFHPPNGGLRTKGEAGKMKGFGAHAGVSDIVILEPRWGYHGFVIELKNKRGKISHQQVEFLNKARDRGYKIAVVWNYDAFAEVVEEYLDEKKSQET